MPPITQRILCLDPGPTTGLCIGTAKDEKLTFQADQFELDEFELWNLLNGLKPIHHLVYEHFKIRLIGAGTETPELIGIIKLFGRIYSINLWPQDPTIQGPKAFFSVKGRLEEMGCYSKGKEHARSATKHLLNWAKFGAGSEFIKEWEMVT